MTFIAAAQVDTTTWWISLAVGLGIAVALVVLLSMLYKAVRQVERDVITLWDTATTVARNTATSWILRETAEITQGLRDELRRHEDLKSGGLRR